TDKFWAGVGIPGLVVLVLLLLPWMDRNPSRKMKDRVFAITGYTLAVLMLGTLTYMGLPIWGIDTSPPVEIQTQMRPAIRNLPTFPELLGCDGQVAQNAVLPECMRQAPGLRRAYNRYLDLIEEFAQEKPDRFRGVTAQMTIQRWQPVAGDPNLMRVTFDLRFTKDILDPRGRKTGEGPESYQFSYYVHRDTHGEGEPLTKF
ncbi:MAG: hypothetical protein HY335_02630, partial [Deinococcus sp.]|nr:hypothetical protein [Deinococcus sp.]